jgi:hypothetical protein
MDLAALDVFVPVMERSITEDVVLLVGIVGRQIGIGLSRRPLVADGWRIIAIPFAVALTISISISVTRRRLRLAFGSVAICCAGLELTAPVSRQGRGVAIAVSVTIASHWDSLVVDGAGLALGAVSGESLPHGKHRLAGRFALAFPDESDGLAIRRALFLERLTVQAVALAVARTG